MHYPSSMSQSGNPRYVFISRIRWNAGSLYGSSRKQQPPKRPMPFIDSCRLAHHSPSPDLCRRLKCRMPVKYPSVKQRYRMISLHELLIMRKREHEYRQTTVEAIDLLRVRTLMSADFRTISSLLAWKIGSDMPAVSCNTSRAPSIVHSHRFAFHASMRCEWCCHRNAKGWVQQEKRVSATKDLTLG